jgi:tRNA(fMet)-specific endonuclease VapC
VKYLLDTDHLSIIQQRTSPEYGAVMAHLALHPRTDVAVCVINFHEQVLGCHTYLTRARTTADLVRGYGMLARVISDYGSATVLPFDAAAGAALDGLVAARVRIGSMDLRIAAIALANGLTVVTRNARHFGLVPGLAIEDWTK